MKEPVKILFIAQELTPYLLENQMSKLCRELPQYMQEQGCEIRIFMPCYGTINERRNQLHEVQRLSGMNLIIDDNDHPLIIKVATLPSARMQVYFIDNDDYFRRRGTDVDENGKEFADNDDRMIFFARGVLETIKKLRWTPNIIHCHGWMTSLVPLYIHTAYRDDPFFEKAKLVYSAYNNPFKKTFGKVFAKHAITKGVSPNDVALLAAGKVGYADVTRLAVRFSDMADAGSPELDETLAAIAEAEGKPFAPYAPDFRSKYTQLYADVDAVFREM